jgi:uncharacterized protein (DUF2147 family)
VSGSLVGTGAAFRQVRDVALEDAAEMESARERERQQIKVADRSQKASLAGTGAALGYAAGAGSAAMGATYGSWAGPIGAVAGAAVGYLLGEFL